MTNLKKTLAVVLAFAMILSMGAISTFAYSDVAEGTIVSEAVDVLSGLKILTGFEDGTFKPDETVTRAQMAAIICRTLGYEDQAQSSMGTTVFNDVAADHWASGYINVAQAQQIINGYGDGNYGPEDLVTYEQAVKMIVSALGYDIAANAKGGYPTGYLAIASAEGITKSANGKVGDAAKRGTIAVLVYNSLEVRLMDQTAWSTDGTDTYQKDNANILTTYLDVVKVEGTVVANPITAIASDGVYTPDGEPFVKIAGNAWVFGAQASYEGYRPYEKKPISQTSALENNSDGKFNAERVDVNDLVGKYVIAYIGDDEVTGTKTVYAIAESKSRNTNIKISASKLVESGKWYSESGYAAYKDNGTKRIALADDVVLYQNYKNLGTGFNTTAAIKAKAPNGGIVEFVSNDGDEEIEYIFVTSYADESVIKKVDEVNGAYLYETYNNGALVKINPEDENSLSVIYKDGVAATAADLAVNDTVSKVIVAKKFDIYYASSATVSGAVDGYNPEDGVVTVAGTDYEVSDLGYFDSQNNIYEVKKLAGEEGTFFLNVDGQIAWNETAPVNSGSYALITALYYENKLGKATPFVSVALADGTVADYEVDEDAELQDFEGNNGVDLEDTLKGGLLSMQIHQDNIPQNPVIAYRATESDIQGSNANSLLVKLTVNGSGKVTKARTLEGNVGTTNSTDEYDAASFSIGSVDFQEDAVIFSVENNSDGYIDADKIKVGTLATFFVDGEDCNALRAYDEDNGIWSVAVGVGLKKAIAVDGNVFVVASKKTVSYNDDDAYVVTGMIAGEEKSITIYNEDSQAIMNVAKALAAGDVILISEPDSEGIVSDIEQLVDFNKATPNGVNPVATAGAVADDDIASGYGLLTGATNMKFFISGDVRYDHDFDGDDQDNTASPFEEDWTNDAQGISYRAANYTLVDFVEDSRYPAVTFEGASKALFDTAYVTYVYVRVVDDRLADVVVYRMEEVSDLEVIPTTEEGNIAAGSGTITFNPNVNGATVLVTGLTGSAATNSSFSDDTVTYTIAAGETLTVTVSIAKDGFTPVPATTFTYTVPAAQQNN